MWRADGTYLITGSWGDAVLRRKDVPASYHIAVVVDDALQGVTDVVRGRDLYDGDVDAPPAAGPARPARAALPPPPPRPRRRRSKSCRRALPPKASGRCGQRVLAPLRSAPWRRSAKAAAPQRRSTTRAAPSTRTTRMAVPVGRSGPTTRQIESSTRTLPAPPTIGSVSDEVAADEGIGASVEEGLVVAFRLLARRMTLRPDHGEAMREDREQQHLALPGQAEDDVDEPGRARRRGRTRP